MGDREGNICSGIISTILLDVKENKPRVIHKPIKVNRKVILRILDIIEEEGNKEFIPCLEAYKKIETKRIGRRIIEVENTIKDKV